MALVATLYDLPPRVLPAIQRVEGGVPGSIHPNADGSADLGVMQVNTRWIASLARSIGADETIMRTRLIDDPCFNIAAAGAILRAYLNETHNDLMRAIGDYHSHTPALNQDYQERVRQSATTLFTHQPPAPVGVATMSIWSLPRSK